MTKGEITFWCGVFAASIIDRVADYFGVYSPTSPVQIVFYVAGLAVNLLLYVRKAHP